MLKLLISGATALMSLGAVSGFLGQEAAPAQEAPKLVEGQAVVEDLRVVSVDNDPAEPIRSAYVILRQLRSERLEDRPRELTDRAAELYRAAVKLHGEGNLVVARRYGTAALNAARAVELARIARQAEGQDDDLPPPPPVQVKILRGNHVIELEKLESLPGLPPVLGEGDDDEGEATKEEPDEVNIIGLPNGKAEVRVYIQKKEGEKAEASEGKAEAKVILRAAPNLEAGSHTIHVQPKVFVQRLPGQQGEAAQQKRSFHVEIPGGPAMGNIYFRNVAPMQANNFARWHLADGPAQARIELRSAYDQIKAARESAGDDEGAGVYLDAAKDLYNAARRDAQAGRNARAAELARAARSLARVPELLKKIEEGDDEAEDKAEETRQESRIFVVPGPDQGEDVVRVRPRIEIRKRVRTPDGKETEEVEVKEIDPAHVARLIPRGDDQAQDDQDDAGPLVGIGVAIEAEDGAYIVRDVIPDSPAAEEGKLKKGDRLIGVKTDDETVEFEGKELVEVVKLIRGKAGTEIRLVVRPEGADEDRVVALTRRELKLPESEAARVPGVEALPRLASPAAVGEIPPALDD
jgi:hypothetical protein